MSEHFLIVEARFYAALADAQAAGAIAALQSAGCSFERVVYPVRWKFRLRLPWRIRATGISMAMLRLAVSFGVRPAIMTRSAMNPPEA